MPIRAPNAAELPALSALCLRSKAVWGYTPDFLEACREELSLKPEYLAAGDIGVAHDGPVMLGVVHVVTENGLADLEKLFVDPPALGRGIGRDLFEWAVLAAKSRGARRLIIEADPDAAPFYRRMGAYDIGSVASGSIPGRTLPELAFDL